MRGSPSEGARLQRDTMQVGELSETEELLFAEPKIITERKPESPNEVGGSTFLCAIGLVANFQRKKKVPRGGKSVFIRLRESERWCSPNEWDPFVICNKIKMVA